MNGRTRSRHGFDFDFYSALPYGEINKFRIGLRRDKHGPHSALILITFLIVHLAPSYANVTVVSSTPSRLVLSWELLGLDTVSVFDGGAQRTRISFNGGYVVTGDSGAVMLPGYSFYAGVPLQGNVRVSLEPEETSVLRLNSPLSRNDSHADSLAPSYSSSMWISEPSYSRMRDYRAAYMVVRPVVDAGQGSVRVLRRARIVVEFPSASHSGASWEPRSDYERMTKRLLLNFRVAQGWLTDARGLRKTAAEREAYPFAPNSKLAAFKVGDGHRFGNEGTTNENSLIKISGKRIIELFGTVPMSRVALYASHRGELDMTVPKEGEIPAGVFEVPLMRFDQNGNGNVDTNDYVIAYVSGSSDWMFDTTQSRYRFDINRYDDNRTYWLGLKDGAMSMDKFEQPEFNAGEQVKSVNYFVNNAYIRTPQSLPYDPSYSKPSNGGINWTWKRFDMNRPDTVIALDMPGIDTLSDSASVSLRLGGRYGSTFLNVSSGPDTLCTGWGCVNETEYFFDPRARASRNIALGMFFQSEVTNSNRDRIYYELDGLHFRYRRKLSVTAAEGRLEVFSFPEDGGVHYTLSLPDIAGQRAYVVRISADGRDISLVDTVKSAAFSFADTGGTGVRYMVMFDKNIIDYSDSIKTVTTARPPSSDNRWVRDLRGSFATDYLIITHEDFLGAARDLAEHKATVGFPGAKVVTVGDIMDQFGGGNMDPAAIRNFLLHVYRNKADGEKTSYVVLMGAGHYDYKGISSRTVNFMPIMYSTAHFGDDYYVFLEEDRHPTTQHDGDYYIGRLPAKSLQEARDMVEKIKEMEDPRQADFGPWRNRTLMTADDDQQGAGYDGIAHYSSSDKASDIIERNRPDIDIRKLYLFEYPWDENYNKPGAKRALINEINSGVSLVSWFGHGSLNQLADEAIFSRADVLALYNWKRYPLFALFSCSINKFDQPGDEALGAALVRQPRAGGIISISSTRDVQATRNENLARPFYESLFDSVDQVTVGYALRYAKFMYRQNDNRYYVLLGDPSISFTPRNLNVKLSVTDTSGKSIDTLKALQLVTVKGTVSPATATAKRGALKNNDSTFISLVLFNPPEDSTRRKDGGKHSNPYYKLPGTPVFSATVKDTTGTGRFEHQVLLPMNLAFGKPGVKLIAYAWKEGAAVSGAGSVSGLIFEGTGSDMVGDTTPPRISIRAVYDEKAEPMNQAGVFVKNRVTSQLPLTLEIAIEDSSGINIVGTGPDEGLTMEITGALSKRSINHLFTYSPGNFRHGIARVTLEENVLKSGTHEMVISAQDLVGNVARQSFTLDIVDAAEIKLDHVLNIPNPVRMGRPTRIYYQHSNTPGDLDINVTIRVYSLGGRLLAVIRNPRNGQEWIPRDQRGNLLSPNVYLYQITATTPNLGKTVKSKIKKMVVHPPR